MDVEKQRLLKKIDKKTCKPGDEFNDLRNQVERYEKMALLSSCEYDELKSKHGKAKCIIS